MLTSSSRKHRAVWCTSVHAPTGWLTAFDRCCRRRFEAPQGIAREHPWYKLIVEGKLHDGGLGATRLLVDFCEWLPTQ